MFHKIKSPCANLAARGLGVSSIEANPLEQTQEDLPPGNVRWMIIDRDNNVVTSFINRDSRTDAVQYMHRWVLDNPQMRDRGPFRVGQ